MTAVAKFEIMTPRQHLTLSKARSTPWIKVFPTSAKCSILEHKLTSAHYSTLPHEGGLKVEGSMKGGYFYLKINNLHPTCGKKIAAPPSKPQSKPFFFFYDEKTTLRNNEFNLI